MSEQNITQLYNITPEELKQSIIHEIRLELKEMSKKFQPVRPTEYVTRKEAAKILKVSLVTIHDWNKKGILKPYRLGNLIRYKRIELDKALIDIYNH